MKNKKGLEMEVLIWWIIALVVLAVIVFASLVLRDKGVGAMDYIKNLFRFGK